MPPPAIRDAFQMLLHVGLIGIELRVGTFRDWVPRIKNLTVNANPCMSTSLLLHSM